MEIQDDDLIKFDSDGAAPLPDTDFKGYVENHGARIWYAAYGSGVPVILLHGGLGNAGNWGYQVPALVANGYQAIVIDSRGHGRSTRDAQPFSYELMASDTLAVMDTLKIQKAGFIGWSEVWQALHPEGGNFSHQLKNAEAHNNFKKNESSIFKKIFGTK